MIEINLLPDGLRKKRALSFTLSGKYLKNYIFTAIAVIVILHILLQSTIMFKSVMLASSERRMASIQAQRRIVDEMKSEVQNYKHLQVLFSQAEARRIRFAPALNLISDVLPQGVWLNGLLLQAQASDLSGACVSAEGGEIAQVGRLLNALRREPELKLVFPELELASVKRKKLGPVEIIEFVMSVKKQAKSPKK